MIRMATKIKNQKGITLVELLAVLAIGGIVIALLMSIFSNGQNQHSSQNAKAEQLNDIRYAAKVITKEIRKADQVSVTDSSLKLGSSSPVIFKLENKAILQNEEILVSGIESFTANKDGRLLKLKIVNSDKKGHTESLETEIFIREGVVIE